MDEATKYLLAQGVLGLVCIGLVWWILRKDKEAGGDRVAHAVAIEAMRSAHVLELKAMREACDVEKAALRAAFIVEKDARIEDAKGYAGLCLQLQKDVLTYVQSAKSQDEKVAEKLGDVAEAIGRNTTATERLTERMAKT